MSKKTNYKTTVIRSLSEFILQLETRISDRYRIILFRGQNIDKALIPSIARHYFKKSREVDEKRMLSEFISNSVSHLEYDPKNTLEKLTLAQHHRVPTRLLDWTENALAAVYFATNGETQKKEEDAVIWSISLERDSEILVSDSNINPYDLNSIRLFKPSNFIQRIASQQGWFSIHSYKGNGFYERAENIIDDGVRISKFIIPSENLKTIQETLDVCGINSYTIFRDLDSLGSYILGKYSK